jgi:hypothetical protein
MARASAYGMKACPVIALELAHPRCPMPKWPMHKCASADRRVMVVNERLHVPILLYTGYSSPCSPSGCASVSPLCDATVLS